MGVSHSSDNGGYSGTPLARKIGVKAGHRVRLRHAPEGWGIPALPAGCDLAAGGPRGADVAVAFYRMRTDLTAEAPVPARELADDAMPWIAWPRMAAGHVSE